MPRERLQKYLAACGISSRRGAEKLIQAGQVEVDGRVVTEMGFLVDPAYMEVKVAGRPVAGPAELVYYALYKPPGYLSTAHDERGRPTVLDLLPAAPERVYPVGRLDLDSEGLILLTNDGALAKRLMHPGHSVAKTYRVTVAGQPTAAVIGQLARGIELAEGPTRPAEVRVVQAKKDGTELEIVLREGRKRQIRRMCAAVGHDVRRLCRIRIGSLSLGDLPPGGHRALSAAEVFQLRQDADL